jgi:hypothetical protein
MSAMVSRVRAPLPAKMPVEITVPALARACGLSTPTMRRRLQQYGVVLHPRGGGAKRRHCFVTWTDLQAAAPHIVDGIRNWNAILIRAVPPPATTEDDDD